MDAVARTSTALRPDHPSSRSRAHRRGPPFGREQRHRKAPKAAESVQLAQRHDLRTRMTVARYMEIELDRTIQQRAEPDFAAAERGLINVRIIPILHFYLFYVQMDLRAGICPLFPAYSEGPQGRRGMLTSYKMQALNDYP